MAGAPRSRVRAGWREILELSSRKVLDVWWLRVRLIRYSYPWVELRRPRTYGVVFEGLLAVVVAPWYVLGVDM